MERRPNLFLLGSVVGLATVAVAVVPIACTEDPDVNDYSYALATNWDQGLPDAAKDAAKDQDADAAKDAAKDAGKDSAKDAAKDAKLDLAKDLAPDKLQCTGPKPKGEEGPLKTFNYSYEYNLPYGGTLCKWIGKIPYIGAALTAGNDDPKIGYKWNENGSADVNGLENCTTESTGSYGTGGSYNFCAWQATLKGTRKYKSTEVRCVDCVPPGLWKCGALSCNTVGDGADATAELARIFKEKGGVGDLILCPEGSVACDALVKRLNERFELAIELPITASGKAGDNTDKTVPGSCEPCKECRTTTKTGEGKLTAQLRAQFQMNIVNPSSWGWWDYFKDWFKISASLTLGIMVGGGAGVERKTTEGACGSSDCWTYYAFLEGGGMIELKASCGKWLNVSFQWNVRCKGKAGFNSCTGLDNPFDGDCKINNGAWQE